MTISVTVWPTGFAFILGFVGPLWVLGEYSMYIKNFCLHFYEAGYDTPVHMSEEAANAATAVPTAIVSSLGSSVVLGFGTFYALMFSPNVWEIFPLICGTRFPQVSTSLWLSTWAKTLR